MSKCQVCKVNQAEWAWQPFGPGESVLSFTAIGWHYRGFPVVKVCDECKRTIEIGARTVSFRYRSTDYVCLAHNIETFKAISENSPF